MNKLAELQPLPIIEFSFNDTTKDNNVNISSCKQTFKNLRRTYTLSQYSGGDCLTHRGKFRILKNFPGVRPSSKFLTKEITKPTGDNMEYIYIYVYNIYIYIYIYIYILYKRAVCQI